VLGLHPKIIPLPVGVVPVAIAGDDWKCLYLLSNNKQVYEWVDGSFLPCSTPEKANFRCAPTEGKYRSSGLNVHVKYGGQVVRTSRPKEWYYRVNTYGDSEIIKNRIPNPEPMIQVYTSGCGVLFRGESGKYYGYGQWDGHFEQKIAEMR
jgi:hypothetical protein